jgi:uncharacterized small protein (DUF1192 family)
MPVMRSDGRRASRVRHRIGILAQACAAVDPAGTPKGPGRSAAEALQDYEWSWT